MSDTPTLPPPPTNPPTSTTSLSIVPFPPPKSNKKNSSKKAAASAPPPDPANEPARVSTGRSLALSSAITKRDRDRWRKWRDGQSEDEIALGEKKDVLTVRKSIQKFLSYQFSVSHEAVDMKANELTIGTLDQLGAVIDDVLKAEKEVTFKNAEGKEESRFVPDLKMRLTAFDKIVDLIQAVRKKDGLSVNVNQNNQTNVAVVAGRSGRSFEARLREAETRYRSEHGMPQQNRSDEEDIIDGEVVEEAEENEDGTLVDPSELDDPDSADEPEE